MKKIGTYLLYGGVFISAIILIYINIGSNKKTESSVQGSASKKVEVKEKNPADKIQVFLFHPTQRCITCITIGKYAKETVEQKFPEEVKSGKIEFREINIDLPENKELANKFKATGSSLFINPIVDGKDNIQQDTQVWRLTSNEQSFITYLSDKINALF